MIKGQITVWVVEFNDKWKSTEVYRTKAFAKKRMLAYAKKLHPKTDMRVFGYYFARLEVKSIRAMPTPVVTATRMTVRTVVK